MLVLAVSFFSRTQKSVILSSAEAEYVAMADGLKETISLRHLWSFIFPDGDVGYNVVKEDSKGPLHWPTTQQPPLTPSTSIFVTTPFGSGLLGRSLRW